MVFSSGFSACLVWFDCGLLWVMGFLVGIASFAFGVCSVGFVGGFCGLMVLCVGVGVRRGQQRAWVLLDGLSDGKPGLGVAVWVGFAG